MKDFPTLREYLKSKQVFGLEKAELLNLKKEYRKLYFKEYNKRRRKHITYTLRITDKQHKRLQAEKFHLNYSSLNAFIIETLFAYFDKGYVFPQEESKQQLINELNAIGTNINQVVHKLHMHSLRMYGEKGTLDQSKVNLTRILDGYTLLKEQVDEVHKKIISFIQTPQKALLGMSWNELKQDKQKLSTLITHLQEHLNTL